MSNDLECETLGRTSLLAGCVNLAGSRGLETKSDVG